MFFTSSLHLLNFSSSFSLLSLSLLSFTTSDLISFVIRNTHSLSLSLSVSVIDRCRSPFSLIYLSCHLPSLDTYIHSSSLASHSPLPVSQPLSSSLDRIATYLISAPSKSDIRWRVRQQRCSFLFFLALYLESIFPKQPFDFITRSPGLYPVCWVPDSLQIPAGLPSRTGSLFSSACYF